MERNNLCVYVTSLCLYNKLAAILDRKGYTWMSGAKTYDTHHIKFQDGVYIFLHHRGERKCITWSSKKNGEKQISIDEVKDSL